MHGEEILSVLVSEGLNWAGVGLVDVLVVLCAWVYASSPPNGCLSRGQCVLVSQVFGPKAGSGLA